jgi:hypothetical protein
VSTSCTGKSGRAPSARQKLAARRARSTTSLRTAR